MTRTHSRRRSSGHASPIPISTALTFTPQATPTSTPTRTSPRRPDTRRATWIAQMAPAATNVSIWPPLTSCWIKTGFATQNSVARTGSSDVFSSRYPTPMNTRPFTIISTQMVVATFAPPTDAAKDWTTVATGPYTERCVFHTAPTTWAYAECAPRKAAGLVRYGFPPRAAIRPYAA